jgi:hypothetical protein
MKRIALLTVTLILAFSELGYSKGRKGYNPRKKVTESTYAKMDGSEEDLLRAIDSRKRVKFLYAANLVVVEVLPDDNQGSRHQKWVVETSNGQQVMAVYNSDMCPRVPVEVGDRIGLAGEYIWTKQGGLIHWLHHDPRGGRPDGFVELEGNRYCD